jgi:hypothetical protein
MVSRHAKKFHGTPDDTLDLRDVLASFDSRGKVSLDELCGTLGLRGRPDYIDGSQVEKFVAEGKIAEVAAYCAPLGGA